MDAFKGFCIWVVTVVASILLITSLITLHNANAGAKDACLAKYKVMVVMNKDDIIYCKVDDRWEKLDEEA